MLDILPSNAVQLMPIKFLGLFLKMISLKVGRLYFHSIVSDLLMSVRRYEFFTCTIGTCFIFSSQEQVEGTQWGRPGPGGRYWRSSAITGQGFFDKMVRQDFLYVAVGARAYVG